MTLTSEQKQKLRAEFGRDLSSRWEQIPLTKPEIAAAIDAINDWVDRNMASFNNGLPEPAKTELTGRQKLQLFLAVIKARWEVS